MDTCFKLCLLKKIFKCLLLFNKSPLLEKLNGNLIEDHLEYGSIMAFHTFCVTIPINILCLLAEKTAYCSNAVLHCSMLLTLYSDSSSSRSILSCCYLWNSTSFFQAHPKLGYCLLYFSLFSETFTHFGFISPTELIDHRDLEQTLEITIIHFASLAVCKYLCHNAYQMTLDLLAGSPVHPLFKGFLDVLHCHTHRASQSAWQTEDTQ